MRQLAAILLVLIAIAGCDSQDGPIGGSSLLGAWTVHEAERATVTVSQTQDVPDALAPGSGAILYAGALNGSVSTLRTLHPIAGGSFFSVQSPEQAAGGLGRPAVSLVVASTADSSGLTLYVRNATESVWESGPGTAPLARDGWTYTFDGVVLRNRAAPKQTVTLSGRYSFGTRTLRAGVPSTLSEIHLENVPEPRGGVLQGYTFQEDGGLRLDYGSEVQDGSWRREGDRVVLSWPDRPEIPHTLIRDGEAFLLTRTSDYDVAGCDVECRSGTEDDWFLRPGTLVGRVEWAREQRLSRGGA